MPKHATLLLYGLLTFTFFGVNNNVLAADSIIGVWQTESTEKGYLHVKVEACEEFVCGTIIRAFNQADEPNEDYEHIGERMVWDMQAKGPASWSRGKIWDPSADKTYKSKMSLGDDVLSVSGCIVFFCKAQDWIRVE